MDPPTRTVIILLSYLDLFTISNVNFISQARAWSKCTIREENWKFGQHCCIGKALCSPSTVFRGTHYKCAYIRKPKLRSLCTSTLNSMRVWIRMTNVLHSHDEGPHNALKKKDRSSTFPDPSAIRAWTIFILCSFKCLHFLWVYRFFKIHAEWHTAAVYSAPLRCFRCCCWRFLDVYKRHNTDMYNVVMNNRGGR